MTFKRDKLHLGMENLIDFMVSTIFVNKINFYTLYVPRILTFYKHFNLYVFISNDKFFNFVLFHNLILIFDSII
jgi:hypothetical protein